MNIDPILRFFQRNHAWTVPFLLLLVSHLCFAGGGIGLGLIISTPLSYFALTYFQKHNTSNHGTPL